MHRIFALAWQANDSARKAAAVLISKQLRARAPEWRVALDSAGLLVLQAGGGPESPFCTMNDDAGVVIGTLFSKDADFRFERVRAPLRDRETAAIVSTKGRHLVSNYWGQYVAVFRDTARDRVFVLRDPSGVVPCWMTMHLGVRVVFSHVEDCLQAGLTDFTVNWTTVSALAAGVALQNGATTLNEVMEVRAGEVLEVKADKVERLICWNPIEIARSNMIVNPNEAITELRNVVTSCIHALAAGHPRIVHFLSGGVDSSIVMSCLKSAPSHPHVTGVNYYTTAAEGDERRYARLAAQHFNIDLVERRLDGAAVDLRPALDASRTLSPAGYAFELLHGAFETDLAEHQSADVFFQGGGGDGVFLLNGAEHAPVDYIQHHGIHPHLMQVAHDVARITRRSVWSVLGDTFKKENRTQRWKRAIVDEMPVTFINPDVARFLKRDLDMLFHPVLADANVPPGKLWHVFISIAPAPLCRMFAQFERPDAVLPLISQPVHEVCLRIPTYVMLDGGWDRAIARRAFENELPAKIVRRRSKGGVDQMMRNILEANISFVRELLLEGALVRERVVDRTKLEQFLRGPFPAESRSCNEIIVPLFDAEVFLNGWNRIGTASSSLGFRSANVALS